MQRSIHDLECTSNCCISLASVFVAITVASATFALNAAERIRPTFFVIYHSHINVLGITKGISESLPFMPTGKLDALGDLEREVALASERFSPERTSNESYMLFKLLEPNSAGLSELRNGWANTSP